VVQSFRLFAVYKNLDKLGFFMDCMKVKALVLIKVLDFSVFKYGLKKLDMLCVKSARLRQ
jgi:hypothetical protein